MIDVDVIDDATTAMVVLDPLRARILEAMTEPVSAAMLAAQLGVPRQKVNYHLRALEKHGLAEVASQRKWGGLTERLLVARARSFVVSPAALGPVGADPGRATDRLSAGYLLALAGRIVREVSTLLGIARRTKKRLATLSIDAEISFRSADERARFTEELTACVTDLVARYHGPTAPGASPHRLIVASHPIPRASGGEEAS